MRTGAALLALLLLACERESARVPAAASSGGERIMLTVGELQAGEAVAPSTVRNPMEGVPNALADGRRFFIWFNCAGCHGTLGGGGMGPPLRDSSWIYGADPASIFQSIAQGRPNGMPAFAPKVTDDQIWRIELYIRSLGGADPNARAGGVRGEAPAGRTQRADGSD